MLTYLALMPQFLPANPSPASTVLLSAITVLAAIGWFGLVALAVAAFRQVLQRPRVRQALDAATGSALITFGVRVAIQPARCQSLMLLGSGDFPSPACYQQLMNHQGRGHRVPTTSTLAKHVTGLAVLCGIAAAGCSSDTGPSSAAGLSAATVAPTATPVPVSPEVYAGELGAVADEVRAAIARLRAATPETLVGDVAAAASMIEDSRQRLRRIVPPAELATNHDLLVTGIGSWAGQISGVGGMFTSGELCTVQAASATVTTLPGLDAVRSSVAALGSAGAVLAEALPAPEPLADRRLENGTVLNDPGSGNGELKIENGTDRDAAITLAQAGQTVGSIYVARDANATLSGVPDGTFELFFTSGTDWDEAAQAFTRSCTFERFESPAVFSTVETGGGIEYTVYSATLQPVPGGTARTSPVPPESFPR